jgi:hypothetical protein
MADLHEVGVVKRLYPLCTVQLGANLWSIGYSETGIGLAAANITETVGGNHSWCTLQSSLILYAGMFLPATSTAR